MPRTPRQTQGRFLRTLDEMFRVGVPAISFLELDYAKAKDYERMVDAQHKYVTEVRGPSKEYDPLRQTPMYSLLVRKPINP